MADGDQRVYYAGMMRELGFLDGERLREPKDVETTCATASVSVTSSAVRGDLAGSSPSIR